MRPCGAGAAVSGCSRVIAPKSDVAQRRRRACLRLPRRTRAEHGFDRRQHRADGGPIRHFAGGPLLWRLAHAHVVRHNTIAHPRG